MKWRIDKLLVASVALSLAACTGYVKRAEFDSAISELRNEHRDMQAQINRLSEQLNAHLSEYRAHVQEMAGRIQVDMTTHFAFDEANLRDQDKPALDAFARVIRDHHRDVLVTVEGFTDPAGSANYNKRLGQRRADAVREYLVSNGGLGGDRVRAVSYGEDQNRQVRPGAWGDDGLPNRRVALVIDYVPRRAGMTN